jgi:RND superfamily putative drug exporter
VAIAVDATLVRLVLVPAIIVLMGDRAWWAPARGRRRKAVVST